MNYRGINYDVGINSREGPLSREEFDVNVVEKEIETISSELKCNAIRIYGYDISRLVIASEFALKNNLCVFFSPYAINASLKDTADYILRGAKEAEMLRARYTNVVFVVACELSIFSQGFICGNTTAARLRRMFNPLSLLLHAAGLRRGYNRRLNLFFHTTMPNIRKQFKGEITYASGTWEDVDWSLFDIVGIDHYRSSFNKTTYRNEMKGYFRYNKPVAVLEFGCCCYKGADEKGAAGWMIVDWDKERPELKGNYPRDESVQSGYLKELLDICREEDVSGAFVFTFVQPSLVYDEDPKYDLDMASYGIVRMLKPQNAPSKDIPWTPKMSFYMLREYYTTLSDSSPRGRIE